MYKQQKDRIPSDKVHRPGEPWGDYVGSEACGQCHAGEYVKWRKSFHSRTLYDAVEGTVIGDFNAGVLDVPAIMDIPNHKERRLERIELKGAPYIAEVFTRRDATGRLRYYMSLRERTEAEGWPVGLSRNTYGHGDDDITLPRISGRRPMVQEVIWTFGNRRHQPYVTRWQPAKDEPDPANDGAFWTLPFFYNDAEHKWQYCGFRRYTESCAKCHTTGIKTTQIAWRPVQQPIAVTPQKQLLYTLRPSEDGWAEGAVGCENCHGPGLEHVRAVERVGRAKYAELRKAGAKPPSIFSGGRSSGESLYRLTQQCDSCHNFHTESSITWIPGPHGHDRDAKHDPLVPEEDTFHMQHFPDGSKKSPCSIGTVYRESKMYKAGVACFDCHDPHGSEHFGSLRLPISDNSLCISCHVDLSEPVAQTLHSKHKEASPGNRCVVCHVPRHMIFTNGQQMMSDRIHNHILSVPKGGAPQGAPPTSCNICHHDRDESWSAAEIRRLWPADAKSAGHATVNEEAVRRAPGDPPPEPAPPPAPPPGAAQPPPGSPKPN
jgi:predicted CXXCH cytochrome family protein